MSVETVILSVLQGVAEFLPVSSSGHLVVAQHALGVEAPGMRLDVFLHVGTLVSIVAYYRRTVLGLLSGMLLPSASAEERRAAWRYAGLLALSALPAVAVYFSFHDAIDRFFENAKMVGALLMFTGAVLIGTRYLPRGSHEVGPFRALMMGVGQAIALLPGVSRSGMTLASARAGKVDPAKSAEFSFLMSAPLIAGAALLELMKSFGDKAAAAGPAWGEVLAGCAIASVVGYFSLAFLVRVLKGKWFWLFGPYCLCAGLLTLVLV